MCNLLFNEFIIFSSFFPHSHIIHCYTIFAFTPRVSSKNASHHQQQQQRRWWWRERQFDSGNEHAELNYWQSVVTGITYLRHIHSMCLRVFLIQYATVNFDVAKIIPKNCKKRCGKAFNFHHHQNFGVFKPLPLHVVVIVVCWLTYFTLLRLAHSTLLCDALNMKFYYAFS